MEMGKEVKESIQAALEESKRSHETLEKLLNSAKVDSVFGQPVQSGDYTLITASEFAAVLGIGFGGGGGSSPEVEDETSEESSGFGVGAGGGGGGGATGRPVAVISIGPSGVEIEPIIDLTKIGIALFTTLGAMFLMISRMRKASRR